MLEEVSSQIANNFKPGYHVMVNPGSVMTRHSLGVLWSLHLADTEENPQTWSTKVTGIMDYLP